MHTGKGVPDFFDCNVTIGKIEKPMPGGVLDAPKLLDEMDRYGIHEALFYHAFAKRHAPEPGNALATEAAAQSERLHACWLLLPPGTGEMPPLDRLGKQMRAAGVRAARIAPDPGGHMFSLAKVACGELFEWLVQTRVPLFIEQAAVSWGAIDAIMEGYPGLRLILTNISYRVNRDLYPRLKAYDDLFVETSGLQQHRGLEDVCSRFGSERFLFGSRLPLLCAGAAIHTVEHAAISEAAKTAIAGRNLRRLLAEVRL